MSWASHRQSQYLLGLFGFLAFVALIIFLPILTKPATCTDGKRNGGETGVDCGGACERICAADVADPQVLWSRAFLVSNSTYNLVAFMENSNPSAGIRAVSYEFRIYDTNNLLIGRRSGTTFVPPNQQFAVFEPRFDAGKSEIRSVTFEFTSPFVWVKKSPTLQTLPYRVDNVIYGTDSAAPSLTARMTNDSPYDLPAFDVVTILYDAKHIAINVSKTHKDGLDSNSTTPLLFTWPQPFGQDPVTQDILPQINPFSVTF